MNLNIYSLNSMLHGADIAKLLNQLMKN